MPLDLQLFGIWEELKRRRKNNAENVEEEEVREVEKDKRRDEAEKKWVEKV